MVGVKGYILDGETVIAETLQCCHCGMHWVIQRGSGIERGFCLKCMGVSCGGAPCWECHPYERQIEDMEEVT